MGRAWLWVTAENNEELLVHKAAIKMISKDEKGTCIEFIDGTYHTVKESMSAIAEVLASESA